jgi:hypothetical protein
MTQRVFGYCWILAGWGLYHSHIGRKKPGNVPSVPAFKDAGLCAFVDLIFSST